MKAPNLSLEHLPCGSIRSTIKRDFSYTHIILFAISHNDSFN